jgi:hypothetical protein
MIQLTDVHLIIDDEVVPVVPNTLVIQEGLGEQTMRAVSIGDGKTEQVYARNLESNFGMVKVSIPTTIEMADKARAWKTSANQLTIQIAGKVATGEEFTRSFTNAALTNHYELQFGTDTNIELEFHGDVAI